MSPRERKKNASVGNCTIHLSKNAYLWLVNCSYRHWLSLFIKLTSVTDTLPVNISSFIISSYQNKSLLLQWKWTLTTGCGHTNHITSTFVFVQVRCEGLKTTATFRVPGVTVLIFFYWWLSLFDNKRRIMNICFVI